MHISTDLCLDLNAKITYTCDFGNKVHKPIQWMWLF